MIKITWNNRPNERAHSSREVCHSNAAPFCSICQRQTKTSLKYSWLSWQNYVVKGNELPLKVDPEKRARYRQPTKTPFTWTKMFAFFPSEWPENRFTNVDRNGQSERKRWKKKENDTDDDDDNGCSYKWKSHRLSMLLNYWCGLLAKKNTRNDDRFFRLFFNMWLLLTYSMAFHPMVESNGSLSQSKFRAWIPFFFCKDMPRQQIRQAQILSDSPAEIRISSSDGKRMPGKSKRKVTLMN